MLAILLAFTTFVSTSLGGLFAISNRDRLHRILGFTAGVLLGVVAFDLLPEIFALTNSTGSSFTVPMVALVVGFLTFHVIEKLTIIHSAHEGEYSNGHHHPELGVVSAIALAAHSFLDGVGIGLAFQVNTGVGLAVAVAVIAHDFSDGLNTVTLMLMNGNSTKKSLWLLLLDATTPLLGAASTLFFHLSDQHLLIYLGFFTGFLLYIGASDILPEAHAKHPSRITLVLTIAGTVLIFLVTRVKLG
ncbi:ZIP family metal transporter [Candidatus Saccharibacteria bacterium]|nr:ZIP family metal transporter [Candidatus Saccharibacteria bacterium]